MHICLALVLFTFKVPTPDRVLVIITGIYALIQAVKKVPALTPYLTGWVAVAVNLIFAVAGVLILVPAGQLYTLNTFVLVLTAALGAAGLHGTVRSFSDPKMLAETPPNGDVAEVEAKLVPKDPADIPLNDAKKS